MPTTIADKRVHVALTRLLADPDNGEFGALALNLTYLPKLDLPAAMATDGTHCWYNPRKLDERTDANTQFTLAHETLHCALGHVWRAATLREQGYSQQEINEAADYCVNAILVASRIGTPAPGLLIDSQYNGLSMEQIARKRRAAAQVALPPPPAQPDPASPEPEPEPKPADDDDDDTADDTQPDDDSDSDSDDASDDADGDDAASEDGDDSADDSSQGDDDTGDADASDSDSADADSDDDSPSDDDVDGTGDGDSDASEQASDAPGSGAFDLMAPYDPAAQGATPTDATSSDVTEPMTAEDWQTATEAAFMVGKRAGVHSGDLERAVNATRQVDPSCWDTLRQFVEATVATDTSWSRPNKRHLWRGMYLPGNVSETTPPLAIAIDTSGSVNQPMLDTFAQHITAIADEFKPRAIHVIYCDSTVRHTQIFDAGDPILLAAKGGGGTAFAPVFDHIADADNADTYQDIAALIYITDLQGDTDSLVEPDYPVLWATPSYYRDAEPFGERIWLP